MAVRRIRRQRMHREAFGMLSSTLPRRLTGMIPRPIMEEQQVGAVVCARMIRKNAWERSEANRPSRP
jgi:hypothetical protein